MGARSVVITTGASGARYLGDVRLEVRHEPIPDALPVGSGDAFLAGLAAAYTSDIAEALRFAAAAARANARRLPAGDITRDSVKAEIPSVRVVSQPQNNDVPGPSGDAGRR
jgi:sugar/nucleoside kinase (ribokinase family)